MDLPCCVDGCKRPGVILCDWRGVAKRQARTPCDRAVCTAHATWVTDDKVLCPDHLIEYGRWRDQQRAKETPQ